VLITNDLHAPGFRQDVQHEIHADLVQFRLGDTIDLLDFHGLVPPIALNGRDQANLSGGDLSDYVGFPAVRGPLDDFLTDVGPDPDVLLVSVLV